MQSFSCFFSGVHTLHSGLLVVTTLHRFFPGLHASNVGLLGLVYTLNVVVCFGSARFTNSCFLCCGLHALHGCLWCAHFLRRTAVLSAVRTRVSCRRRRRPSGSSRRPSCACSSPSPAAPCTKTRRPTGCPSRRTTSRRRRRRNPRPNPRRSHSPNPPVCARRRGFSV